MGTVCPDRGQDALVVCDSNPEAEPFIVRYRRDERRAQLRLRCKGVAEVVLFPSGEHVPGTLLDLSVAGCCIETDRPLPPVGTSAVEVQLSVNRVVIRLAGTVRNLRRQRRAGIEFVDLPGRKAAQIKEVLEELFRRQFYSRA